MEPVDHPRGTEIVSEGGFFQVQLPSTWIDRPLLLRLYHGPQEFDLIRAFLEARRVRDAGDRYVYTLRAHRLSLACERLDCDPANAIEVRDSLRVQFAAAPDTDESAKVWGKAVAVGAGAAALLVGVAATASSGGGDDPPFPPPPDSLVSVTADTLEIRDQRISGLPPGEWPSFARLGSSPAIGRTVTSERSPGEAAIWNPSALASRRRTGFYADVGEPREFRIVGFFNLATPQSAKVRLKGVLTLGFLGFRADRETELLFEDGSRTEAELPREESLAFVGAGLSLGKHFSLGATLQAHEGKFAVADSLIRTTRTFASGRVEVSESLETTVFTHEEVDANLSFTWDPGPRHRVAVTLFNVLGSEAIGSDGEPRSLREAAAGYAFFWDYIHVGGELDWRDGGELDVAAGVNVRPNAYTGLDLGGGTRYNTVQAGIDFYFWRARLNFRVRWDDFDSPAVTGGLELRNA